MTSAWNPQQYERFRAERRQPALDLLALVRPRPGLRIVDLGCGTGEVTRLVHERLAAHHTVGLDNSESMLAETAKHVAPGLEFAARDIAEFSAAAEYDLVFSNAALHWLPDHAALFARLADALAAGGQLAVQMPFNFDHPSHTVAAAVAREEPFARALGGFAIDSPVLEPAEYAALLYRLGFVEQHVRMQVYAHVLPERDAVIDWVRGTLLTEYQRRLAPELFPLFLERYRARLLPQLQADSPYLYLFQRVLLWAQKS
jgi:trans-aconitate 2-methyltransferase